MSHLVWFHAVTYWSLVILNSDMNKANDNGFITYWSWNWLYIFSRLLVAVFFTEKHFWVVKMFVSWKTADRKLFQEVTLQWHQMYFTNLKNVFLPTEFLWSSTVSHVSLTRYFWAGVRGITADFSLGLWEEDPQPMLVTNRRHLYEVQKVELNWDDLCQENIDCLGRLTTFSHDMCLTPLLFNILQNYFVWR